MAEDEQRQGSMQRAREPEQGSMQREREPEQRRRAAEPAEAEQADVEVEREHGAPSIEELDPETRARREAALRHVRKLGDPALRATAVPVERFDEALEREIERMGELMADALGVGLAATQLGVLHRVLVYRVDVEDELTALVNPVLEWQSEERELGFEGCLSLPGVHVEVERAAQVKVRAQDARGAPQQLEASGLAARVIQHEIDHLDGVLILDRISREERKEAMRTMREAREGGEGHAPEQQAGEGSGAERAGAEHAGAEGAGAGQAASAA
jgi:peptide deformylase